MSVTVKTPVEKKLVRKPVRELKVLRISAQPRGRDQTRCYHCNTRLRTAG